MTLTLAKLKEIIKFDIEGNSNLLFSGIGLADTKKENSISFLDDEKYLPQILENQNITAVITTSLFKDRIKENGKAVLLCEDPRYEYYALFNQLAKMNKKNEENLIHTEAKISPRASIAERNVKIGKGTVIEPNVVILEDVEIGENCIIRSGAVLGTEGFEYKRTSKGVIPVYHDGKIIIGNFVEIGANSCVDKGFSFRDTIIKDYVKIDNLVHIAHAVEIGEESFVIACSMVAGSVTIGKKVWLGPNCSIAPGVTLEDEAFITLGSVVTKNVGKNEWVTGNFAIPHSQFIKNLKEISAKGKL